MTGIDEGWSRIDEGGRAAMANGGKPDRTGWLLNWEASGGSQRMSRSFFWGDAEKTGALGEARELGRSGETVWLVLEELDEKVLAEEVGVWEEETVFGIRRKDQEVGFREGR